MKSAESGMTMLDVLVVMGIFVLASGFALLFTMDSYRSSSFHSDRDLFVSLLQRARSQALNTMCLGGSCSDGASHGVAIVGSTYVLFEGESYATRDASIESVLRADPSVSRTGTTEVVFSRFAATTSATAVFTLSSGDRTSDITVATNGRIFWTN